MTPPALSAPPPPAANRAAAPAAAPELRPRAPLSRARAGRPPLLTGRTFAGSIVLHLLLLAAVFVVPRPEHATRPGDVRPAPDGESVEYLEVGEWGGMATDPSASLPEPEAAPPAAMTAAAVDSILRALPPDVAFPERVPAGIPRAGGGGPVLAQPGGVQGGVPGAQGTQQGGAGARRSGPGGLGPELGDSRLVVTPTAAPERIPTDEERYQEHFAGRIRDLNDSIASEADRARRAREWTITDKNGRRWGITDRGWVAGGRELRGVPVPNPIPRSARDREDEARREREQRAEIDRQADQTERARYLRERGRAVRERNDRERQEQAAGGTQPGQGTQANP